jgi:hypothetical protein
MRRRHYLLIVAAALIIALIAWALLASGKSTAPEAPSGGLAPLRVVPAGGTAAADRQWLPASDAPLRFA